MSRLRWDAILAHAKPIVQSYDTGVTLRQLFYRLVADETLPNTQTAYKALGGIHLSGLGALEPRFRVRDGAFWGLVPRLKAKWARKWSCGTTGPIR